MLPRKIMSDTGLQIYVSSSLYIEKSGWRLLSPVTWSFGASTTSALRHRSTFCAELRCLGGQNIGEDSWFLTCTYHWIGKTWPTLKFAYAYWSWGQLWRWLFTLLNPKLLSVSLQERLKSLTWMEELCELCYFLTVPDLPATQAPLIRRLGLLLCSTMSESGLYRYVAFSCTLRLRHEGCCHMILWSIVSVCIMNNLCTIETLVCKQNGYWRSTTPSRS